MQSNTAIAAAAVGQERTPTQTVKVDWDANGNYTDTYDDLSSRVESITIQRQLATDLPDEVSRVAGCSSAQMDVVLSGDPTTEASNAAAFFSPFNTASGLYGKRRRWRTCQAQIGFQGAGTLPAFTGKTTGLTVDSASRTATLTALDNAETMRGVVDLPMVVKDDLTAVGRPIANGWRPNLNASWVVDYIARKCGFYASPPPRTNCKFLATLAGSAAPEIGSGAYIYNLTSGADVPVTFTTGKFIQALDVTNIGNENYTPLAGLTFNNGGEFLTEGLIYVPSTGVSRAFGSVATSGTAWAYFSLNTSNAVSIVVNRGDGTTHTWATGLTIPTAAFTYAALHVYVTSTTIYLHCRIGSTSASTTFTATSVTGLPDVDTVRLTSDNAASTHATGCRLEAWQVSVPGTTTSAPTWNDGFTPTSTIMPSLNALSATVPQQISAWEQIQQLAAAEFATAGFDESGNFYYYNRNRWTTAPWTTSQRTIQASDSLTAIATSETTDQLRNHIRITATPATLNAQPGWVWALSDVVKVPAGGNTTITADTGTPVYNLSTSITYASTNGGTSSRYRAATAADGSGTAVSNLTFTVTVSGAQVVTIVVHNPNASDAYLVTPGTTFTDPQGTPSLALWGQPVTFGANQQPDTTSTTSKTAGTVTIDVSDSTSIGQHGDQLLELSGNPWLQDATSLATLANDLLARLKDPLPMLDGLTIVGDPRLQLGDRVTIVEPTLGLNGDFFLTGITSTFDASGLIQALTVRAIS